MPSSPTSGCVSQFLDGFTLLPDRHGVVSRRRQRLGEEELPVGVGVSRPRSVMVRCGLVGVNSKLLRWRTWA